MMIPKPKHDITTHAFYFSNALKGFKNAWKHRQKYLDQFDNETDFILVDSYGEALKFYDISKCVFLGKSLVKSLIKDSGQNPIEPARIGCKIFHGPNVSNFVEIYEYLKTLEVTQEINNSEELSISLVEEFKANRAKNKEIAPIIENYGQNIFNNVIIELKKNK